MDVSVSRKGTRKPRQARSQGAPPAVAPTGPNEAHAPVVEARPVVSLREAARAAREAHDLVDEMIGVARSEGLSWHRIALELGQTAEAVRQRHGRRLARENRPGGGSRIAAGSEAQDGGTPQAERAARRT